MPNPLGPLTESTLRGLQATAGNRATTDVVVQRITLQRAIGWSQAEAVARQLHEAMSGLGTDEEAIYGALAGRTARDLVDIRDIYRQLYDEDLDEELRDELTDEEFERVRPTLEAPAEETMTAGERAEDAMDRAAAIADQLHEAMEGLGTEEDQIFNALTGRTPTEIEEITRQYAVRHDESLEAALRDDLSGDELRRALALIGREDRGTFENTLEQRMTEGATTVVRGQFTYTLSDDELDVVVAAHFQPAEGVSVPLGTWNSQIDAVWNQFAITEPGGRRVALDFALQDDPGSSREIRVVQNSTPGTYGYPDRANAGMFYPVMPPSTAPHEFGHLIGLPDEYQRTAEDFAAITGETREGPTNSSGKTEEEIAAELHAALTVEDVTRRAPGATTILVNCGLIVGGVPQQGNFAQAVMEAYNDEYGEAAESELLPTLQGLPSGTNWSLMTVFSYASGTVMGNPEEVGTREHEHPVMPRHLREFRSIVYNRWPGLEWQTE